MTIAALIGAHALGFQIVERGAHDGERRAQLVRELAAQRAQILGVLVEPRSSRSNPRASAPISSARGRLRHVEPDAAIAAHGGIGGGAQSADAQADRGREAEREQDRERGGEQREVEQVRQGIDRAARAADRPPVREPRRRGSRPPTMIGAAADQQRCPGRRGCAAIPPPDARRARRRRCCPRHDPPQACLQRPGGGVDGDEAAVPGASGSSSVLAAARRHARLPGDAELQGIRIDHGGASAGRMNVAEQLRRVPGSP